MREKVNDGKFMLAKIYISMIMILRLGLALAEKSLGGNGEVEIPM